MVRKYSVTIRGHRTSFSLEPEFHDQLAHIARREGKALAAVIARIDSERPHERNLSSALRLFVLEKVKSARD